VSIGVTGVNIARNGASLVQKLGHVLTDVLRSSMRHVDSLVPVTSLSPWAFFLVAYVLGYGRFWYDLRPQPAGYRHNLQTLCDVERPPRTIHRLLLRISLPLGSRP